MLESRRVPRRLTAAIGVLVVAGAMACGSDNNKNTTTAPTTTDAQTSQIISSIKSDSNIFAVLHWSDVGEINAGKLMMYSGQDTGVKSFASEMVFDHTALDSSAANLMQQIGVTAQLPDSTLPNAIQAEEDSLVSLAKTPPSDSTAFDVDSITAPPASTLDKRYIASQVKDHVRTLAIVDAAIKVAQNQALVTMLQSSVRPVIATHLSMAQDIQNRIGTP